MKSDVAVYAMTRMTARTIGAGATTKTPSRAIVGAMNLYTRNRIIPGKLEETR